MMHTITDAAGTARIEELPEGGCEITVTPLPGVFCPRLTWRTRYPLALVEQIAEIHNTAWLLDEIARDEDPYYLERDLRFSLLAYVEPEALRGKQLLDFGCGGGASTMVMARMFPDTEFVGVELVPRFVELAQTRARFYGRQDISLMRSSSEDSLPVELPKFDFVLFSAVYEHLLPSERAPLLSQVWEKLRPGGVLFLNQTPDRRFPIETHTTGLPLINYLPDPWAKSYACRFSSRVAKDASWETLLRAGIRGTTPVELLHVLEDLAGTHHAELLQPTRLGVRCQSDIWYRAAAERIRDNWGPVKRQVMKGVMSLAHWARMPVAPYVSLAFRKI